jgi:hypothetical protein
VQWSVELAAGVFVSRTNNSFAGFNASSWTFTTQSER